MKSSKLETSLVDSLAFLREFSWLFNFANIKIFEVLDTWPIEWLQFIERLESVSQLKQILNGQVEPNLFPSFIESFVSRRNTALANLTASIFKNGVYQDEQSLIISEQLKRGMSVKKQHEVIQFSNHIFGVLKYNKDFLIVDIGSGLGYVDQILNDAFGFDVIGVESNAGHAQGAKRRVQKQSEVKMDQINFAFDSSKEKREELESLLPSGDNLFLIGLHSCGDLTPAIFNWFTKSDRVRGISVVSCCYHKMTDDDSYPLSSGLKCIDLDPLRSIYSRRLASQDSFETWISRTESEHREKATAFAVRSIVETFSKENDANVEKCRRKCLRNIQYVDQDAFANIISQNFDFRSRLTGQLLDDETTEAKLTEICERLRDRVRLLELVSGFQYFLQLLLELVIVGDRVLFLQEKGFEPSAERIFNETISPRRFVITCRK